MNLDFSKLSSTESAALLSGNTLIADSDPIAQAYAGHQFGHFTNLGDGRAILLGEHVTADGRRLDVQLKGSGRTPYSRGGDGRAALGPMLREYIISEAMYGLGIETTRSLAVTTTGEEVYRETPLRGAILTRVAKSHIRVGTFQFAAAHRNVSFIRALADYTIDRHFPDQKETQNPALAMLSAFMEQQIRLIVQWMRVGFIHGVMNTDNMALSGETIDYGPCAFMDTYNPSTVFSSIDHGGRYAFGNQPVVAQWNIARFAETLLPLINDDSDKALTMAGEVMSRADRFYQETWLDMMRCKLGLVSKEAEDEALVRDLLDWMKDAKADYTNTFRDLTYGKSINVGPCQESEFEDWRTKWEQRRNNDLASLDESTELMRKSNPVLIPRNHKVEEALSAAQDSNLKPLLELLNVLKNPYQETKASEPYQVAGHGPYQTFCGT